MADVINKCPTCNGTGCIPVETPDVAQQVVGMLALNPQIRSVQQEALRMIREAIREGGNRCPT